MNQVINLAFVGVFSFAVRFIEEFRFEFFEPVERLPIFEFVFIHTEQRIAGDDLVEQIWQRLDLLHVLLVHDEREPEAELGDFDRTGVNVHAIKAVLDRVALELVGRALVNVIEVRRERGTSADNFSHHTDRERT